MAYYKILIEVWCDWNPKDRTLEEIAAHVETASASAVTPITSTSSTRAKHSGISAVETFKWASKSIGL